MPREPVPSEVQHEILKALWARGEATVTEVGEALRPRRALAPTTVATLLRRLERKGWVAHRAEGRSFLYRARVSEAAVRARLLSQVTDRLFDGDVAALVHHLLEARDIDRDDLARLRGAIAKRERERGVRDVR